MQNPIERTGSAIRDSQLLRLLTVGALALLLQIPIAMIGGLVSERQDRRKEAITEVSSRWGDRQAITGPALVVPYTYHWKETSSKGEPIVHTSSRTATFLPRQLRSRGTIESESLHRGIFSIPVYKLRLQVEGEFAPLRLTDLDPDVAEIHWDQASLVVGISDVRAIQQQTAVTWNGKRVSFLAGTGESTFTSAGIHAPVGAQEGTTPFQFTFPLVLNGTVGIDFSPLGESTVVELRSNSGEPSFQGKWLPSQRTVSRSGFGATWDIPSLGRNFPQAWTSESSMRDAIAASHFGVDLVDTVDHYRMAGRSVKYAGLFILLTFTCVWLIEVMARVQVHPIQYFLLGAALCLFYLLELSLSEHLGFTLAFTGASLAVIAMVAAYAWVILQRASRALIVGAGVSGLYLYLYVLLMNEDFALLVGSIALFIVLGTVMFVTRHVDWFALGARAASPPESS